jgi:hypothetical protein
MLIKAIYVVIVKLIRLISFSLSFSLPETHSQIYTLIKLHFTFNNFRFSYLKVLYS